VTGDYKQWLDGEASDLYGELQDVDGAYAAGAKNVEDFLDPRDR